MILFRHFLVFAFFPLLLLGCGASSVPIGITFSHRNLVYHGGAVMHHVTAYATFWLPKPYHFEPSGNDAAYQHLVEQFLKDVGGTSYYRILTQYSYAAHHRAVAGGPILNRLRFGGAYTDRTPFPRPGTVAHPLKRDDWENELLRVLNHTPWNPGPNALFILFLPANTNVCYDASTCTFDTGNGARDCGLHSAFGVTSHRRTFSVVDIILPDSFSVNDPAMCAPLDQDHSEVHPFHRTTG